MKILNPFKMIDWEIKKFLKFVIFMQIILWTTIGLGSIGLHIPIIRELTAMVCLLFINGVLILRILRIHGLGNIENILYSIGLSISVLMLLGMLISLIYPFLGIQKPISLIPLMITFTIFVSFLCVLSYLRDKTFRNPVSINLAGLTNPLLFLFLIPFLAIFGTYTFNYYQNNTILMIMFILIAFIPLLVAFDKFIPKKLYPLAIFSISLSLLFSGSLISSHVTGWDINLEYYFSNLVVSNSYWDASLPEILNAMLTLVMIIPIFSKISGLSVVSVFKIIFPIIYALVPLGLYSVFKKQTNNKIAFFACFLFISVFMFFLVMPGLARQEIGELFFVLLVMLMVENNLNNKNISILTIFFITALLVSHYSMDYIYISLLGTAYLLISIRNLNLKRKFPFLDRWQFIKFFFVKSDSQEDTIKMNYKLQLLLVISITISYYILVSSSALFNLTVLTLNNIVTVSIKYLFSPTPATVLNIVTSDKSFLRSLALVLHLIIQFLIFIGILLLIYRRTDMKFNENFSLFSVISFLMMMLVVMVPFLANALNPDRFYQIALIFLSVFFVVGWIGFFNILNRILGLRWKKESIYNTSLKLIAIFLAVSLIFNSGVVYEIFGDKPTSISLHSTMDGPKFNEREITGAQWISMVQTNSSIYADTYRILLLRGFSITHNTKLNSTININESSYIYLGTLNILYNQYGESVKGSNIINYSNDTNFTSLRNEIFDDGGSQVFQ